MIYRFIPGNPQHVELLLQRLAGLIPAITRHGRVIWASRREAVSDKKKLEYLIQFSKAMPREHNLILRGRIMF